jgi:hypothetical protein
MTSSGGSVVVVAPDDEREVLRVSIGVEQSRRMWSSPVS